MTSNGAKGFCEPVQEKGAVGHSAIVQVMDLGSLNGTSLNGRIISTSNRRRSRLWRLNDGDEIKLGVRSTLKITYLPLQDGRVRPFLS